MLVNLRFFPKRTPQQQPTAQQDEGQHLRPRPLVITPHRLADAPHPRAGLAGREGDGSLALWIRFSCVLGATPSRQPPTGAGQEQDAPRPAKTRESEVRDCRLPGPSAQPSASPPAAPRPAHSSALLPAPPGSGSATSALQAATMHEPAAGGRSSAAEMRRPEAGGAQGAASFRNSFHTVREHSPLYSVTENCRVCTQLLFLTIECSPAPKQQSPYPQITPASEQSWMHAVRYLFIPFTEV